MVELYKVIKDILSHLSPGETILLITYLFLGLTITKIFFPEMSLGNNIDTYYAIVEYAIISALPQIIFESAYLKLYGNSVGWLERHPPLFAYSLIYAFTLHACYSVRPELLIPFLHLSLPDKQAYIVVSYLYTSYFIALVIYLNFHIARIIPKLERFLRNKIF